MSTSTIFGLILALVTAAAFNWSWVAQHTITSQLPKLTIRHPWRSLRLLFANRRWLFAFMIGITGWALYILALRLAPLSLVQTVSAGGLALLAVLAQRAEGVPLPPREWLGVGLAIVGLVFLSVSLAGGSSGSSTGSWIAVTAWFVDLDRGRRHLDRPGRVPPRTRSGLRDRRRAALRGGRRRHEGGGARRGAPLLRPPDLRVPPRRVHPDPALVPTGRALATAGLSSFCTNALPIAAGLLIFHETAPPGILGALRFVAFGCVVLGAAFVARREGGPEERPEHAHASELPVPAPATE